MTDAEIDHIYIAVSKDFSTEDQSIVHVRGFVYEYLSQGKKNIGIHAVTIKKYKNL